MSQNRLAARVTARYYNRVRDARLRALVRTQEELARMTGIHRGTISASENGRRFLGAPHALLIAEALACSLDDLYDRRGGSRTGPAGPDPKRGVGRAHAPR